LYQTVITKEKRIYKHIWTYNVYIYICIVYIYIYSYIKNFFPGGSINFLYYKKTFFDIQERTYKNSHFLSRRDGIYDLISNHQMMRCMARKRIYKYYTYK